jgi:hypothetical protein
MTEPSVVSRVPDDSLARLWQLNQMTVDLTRVENFLSVAVNQITTQVLIGFCTLVYLVSINPWLAALA